MGYETEIVATGIDKDVAEDILINMGYNVSIYHEYTFSGMKIWYRQKDKMPIARWIHGTLEIKTYDDEEV